MDYLRDLDLVNSLCNKCMHRQGIVAKEGECYICNGLMDRLDEIFELIKHAIKDYEFNTFLIGATLPPGILEREDEIRSRLKIKGRRSIKHEITSTLSKRLSSNAKVSFTDPDLSIYVDLRGDFVSVKSKPIYLFGRYKKERRGIEQKSVLCDNCKGIRCHLCNFKGSKDISIEEILSEHLMRIYAADDIKFSWIGGEDEESLVLNKGRPFFVKIINPRKRTIDYRSIRIESDGIEAWFTEQVSKFPDKAIRFRSRFRVLVSSKEPIDPKKLSDLKIESISIMNKNRSVKKSIYRFNVKQLDENSFEIELVAESGLPIKRLVEGGTDLSLSQLLEKKLICKHFDVLDVTLVDSFIKQCKLL